MNVIPIPTKLAKRVAAYEKALAENIPDGKERVQAIVDIQAFLEWTMQAGQDMAEWDDDDLDLFEDEFVAQSGVEKGLGRFFNLLLCIDMLVHPDDGHTLSA
jgi:hypothetical protein